MLSGCSKADDVSTHGRCVGSARHDQEAPLNLVYSQGNRSACCRIPMYSEDPRAKRVEFRISDASGNGYLALAAVRRKATPRLAPPGRNRDRRSPPAGMIAGRGPAPRAGAPLRHFRSSGLNHAEVFVHADPVRPQTLMRFLPTSGKKVACPHGRLRRSVSAPFRGCWRSRPTSLLPASRSPLLRAGPAGAVWVRDPLKE